MIKALARLGYASIAMLTWLAATALPADPANAQEPQRRYALLVGIGEYARLPDGRINVTPLTGPPNDVALMRQLLQARYEFAPENVLVLEGRQATHRGIVDAFRQHLIANARRFRNAQIVFYFSGHGSVMTDTDNDEGDGVDETLVAYDSRLPGGRDISDDTINALFTELARYTDSSVFILDSCHSGTGTRDVDGPVARELPPARPIEASALTQQATESVANRMLPRRTDYVVLTGAMASERSYEGDILVSEGTVRRHGYFTYHLVQALNRAPTESYGRIMRGVATAVTRVSRQQHPQAEGDIERMVFGGANDRTEPYIRIREAYEAMIQLDAGEAYGLREGAIVAIYSAETNRLTGETGRLANARVTNVRGFSATAELSEAPARPISLDDKAVVVSLAGAGDRFRVRIDELNGSSATEDDGAVHAALSTLLSENQLIEIAASGAPWDVSVRSGCAESGRLAPTATAGCPRAYYAALSTTNDPLYHALVDEGDAQTRATRLVDILSNKARQENVRALDNERSPMRGGLTVRLQRLDTGGAPTDASPGEGPERLRLGEQVRFAVSNTTTVPLYASLIVIEAGGAIHVAQSDRIEAGRTMYTGAFNVTAPTGFETYKVIATTNPDVNFNVLEQAGVTRAATLPRANPSPLEALLEQSGNTQTRALARATQVDLDSWTTSQIDAVVTP